MAGLAAPDRHRIMPDRGHAAQVSCNGRPRRVLKARGTNADTAAPRHGLVPRPLRAVRHPLPRQKSSQPCAAGSASGTGTAAGRWKAITSADGAAALQPLNLDTSRVSWPASDDS